MPQFASPVFVAARPLAGRTLVALGIPTAALCIAIIAKGEPVKPVEPVSIELPAQWEDAPIAPAVVTETAPERGAVMSKDISLVFAVRGGLYMKLADLSDKLPTHDKPTLFPSSENNWVETSIAHVAPANVPGAYASWIGRDVVVDGSCTAMISRIAIAARLVGDTGYVGDGDDGAWTGVSVLENGSAMLVAELDGCTTGSTARAAELANPLEMAVITDAKLVAKAKRALIRSRAGRAAQKQWSEPEWMGEGSDYVKPKTWWQASDTKWKGQVLRHPTTGAVFVSMHAQQSFACGGPEVNVWGLFRVETDGELAALDASLGEIYTIDRLVDLDHDGTPEVMGTALLSGPMINDFTGTTLTKIEQPFYGCAC